MKTSKLSAFLISISFALGPQAFANNMNQRKDMNKPQYKDIPNADMNTRSNRDSKTDGAITYGNSHYNSKTSRFDHGQYMNKDVVKEVQRKLNSNNFSTGSVDGIYGNKTSSAIRDFQRSENIEVTGRLNQETLDALGVDYKFSDMNKSNQKYSE